MATSYTTKMAPGGLFNQIGGANSLSADTYVPYQEGDFYVYGDLYVSGTVDGRDIALDGLKLDGIEEFADVTDTENVTAAGALMDSEVDANIKTFVLPPNTTISAYGATLIDDNDAETARTTLDVDVAGTALIYAIALG